MDDCECKYRKTIKCLVKSNKLMRKEIHVLQCQVNSLTQIIQISNGEINVGSMTQPVDNLYVTNIVSTDFTFKGLNLDDNTASLTPSFDSFPQTWLTTNINISALRTYHYTLNTPSWIKWAVENNLSVMIGITLNNYKDELDTLSQDYLNNSSKYDSYIIAIAIGNEESTLNISSMNEGMLYAKTLINNNKLPKNAKVTTVLRESPDWISPTYPPVDAKFTNNFLQLSSNLDIICFNMYDGYTNPSLPLEVRLSWISDPPNNKFSLTLNGFGAMRFAMLAAGVQDKQFWCTELGWASSGSIPGSNIENLKIYYDNFLNFNMTIPFYPQTSPQSVNLPNRLFYFTIRDANNENYGLYYNDAKLNPKF